MWSLARREQFSFPIKSMTSQETWNRLRALKLCAIYRQSCVEFLTTLGTAALMASNFSHTGQIKSLHHHNLASWPKKIFWYCPNFVCHFLFHFLRIEILELTAKKHVWTYWHLNVWNKHFYEHACATVIQPKAGVLNLLLCHGPLWESGETCWPLLTKMYLNT